MLLYWAIKKWMDGFLVDGSNTAKSYYFSNTQKVKISEDLLVFVHIWFFPKTCLF